MGKDIKEIDNRELATALRNREDIWIEQISSGPIIIGQSVE